MNITVTDLASKPEWVYKVSCVLHDATVQQEPEWDKDEQCFHMSLLRIYWEGGERRRFLRLVPYWSFPGIPARLTVRSVAAVSEERRKQKGRGEPELLMAFDLPSENALEIRTGFGAIHLSLMPGAGLKVVDTGRPSKEGGWTDVPGPILDLELAREVAGTRMI